MTATSPKTTILIEQRHLDWLRRNGVNLSAMVRDHIDAQIDKEQRQTSVARGIDDILAGYGVDR